MARPDVARIERGVALVLKNPEDLKALAEVIFAEKAETAITALNGLAKRKVAEMGEEFEQGNRFQKGAVVKRARKIRKIRREGAQAIAAEFVVGQRVVVKK